MKKVIEFLKKVRTELKKVTWPGWHTIKSSTTAVVVVSLFFGIYIGLVDMALDMIFKKFFLT